MMGLAKLTGDVTYRAACGDEVYDRRQRDKPKRLGPVAMGWQGDSRAEDPDMRVNQNPPTRCLHCKYLRAEPLSFFHDECKEFYQVPAWFCHTYKAVEQGGGGE